jgi:hypothetical protein
MASRKTSPRATIFDSGLSSPMGNVALGGDMTLQQMIAATGSLHPSFKQYKTPILLA